VPITALAANTERFRDLASPLAGPTREVIHRHWLPVPCGIAGTELGLAGALVV